MCTPHECEVSICHGYAGVSVYKRVDFITAVMSSQQNYHRLHQHHANAHEHPNTRECVGSSAKGG